MDEAVKLAIEGVSTQVRGVDSKLDGHIEDFKAHVEEDKITAAQVHEWTGAIKILGPLMKWLLGLAGAGLSALVVHVVRHWH